MEKKNILPVIIGIAVLIFVGYLITAKYYYSPLNQPLNLILPSLSKVEVGDNVQGNQYAQNVLIEYSDFQCPACKSYAPVVAQLSQELGSSIAIVYRNFPLRSIHKNAQLAAQTAQAAGLQGKFWEMHDLLFENQSIWSPLGNPMPEFEKYATVLELDPVKFKADIESEAVIDKINADYTSGIQAGVNSTPTFIYNGEILPQIRTVEQFKQVLAEKAKK